MRTFLITALGVVTFAAHGAAQQPPQEAASAPPTINAKALFFGSDNQVVVAPTAALAAQPTKVAAAQPPKRQIKSPDTKAGLGASYFVRLQRQDGTTRDVLASHDFRTGERFQIGVRVNKPVHVYIYNQEANGNVAVLYPQPGQPSQVDALGTVFLPAKGSFEFVGQPGTEQVSVLLSDTPISDPAQYARSRPVDVETRAANDTSDGSCAPTLTTAGSNTEPTPKNAPSTGSSGDVMVATAAPSLTYKAISFRPTGDNCQAPPKLASKAIQFVNDPAPAAGEQAASYVFKPAALKSDVLHLKLKLSHR